MLTPRALAEELERNPVIPRGEGDRFAGYGVMGLPFSSGHFLAFRRMSASSLGPAYTTIWHRSPSGRWTFLTDVDPNRSCPRFFEAKIDEVVVGDLELSWDGPFDLSLRFPDARFQWGLRLHRDLWTRGMSLLSGALPHALMTSDRVLSFFGLLGGSLLKMGRISLTGFAPNGQRYRAVPKSLWWVEATTAILYSRDLGPLGHVEPQPRLGDFWLPNRGIFGFGETHFTDLPKLAATASV